MDWYLVLVAPAVTAIVIRADAVLIGPYFKFYEVVPGMGGVDADFAYERPTLRWALIRRYLYGALLGAFIAVYDSDHSGGDAALAGGVTAGLLLWPLVFHGLPYGIARSDWLLLPLYVGVVTSFVAASAIGSMAVDYVREQSDGDVVDWLRDELFEIFFWPGVFACAVALFHGSYKSLREKKRRREHPPPQ